MFVQVTIQFSSYGTVHRSVQVFARCELSGRGATTPSIVHCIRQPFGRHVRFDIAPALSLQRGYTVMRYRVSAHACVNSYVTLVWNCLTRLSKAQVK